MKRLILFLFIILSSITVLNAQQDTISSVSEQVIAGDKQLTGNSAAVAEQAGKEYLEGNFRKAIDILEDEIKMQKEQGKVSSELYYNLGNAYFRVNEYAHALLNYERAHLYDPGDRDIRHNIEYTRTKVEDKILTADNFFLKIWFEGVQNLLTSNSWAVLSIVLFLLCMVCLVLFFFVPVLNVKKMGFYVGIILFILLIFTNIFAFKQKYEIENRDTAIVMAGSAPVVSSPASSSKELFILHAGTKVVITKSDGDWYEIEIANGNVGWIQKTLIEII